MVKKSPNPMIFPEKRDYPGYLSDIPNGPVNRFDNPDGVVPAFGLGCYEAAYGGRDFSQGAGTIKGTGAASGHGQVMRVANGAMDLPSKGTGKNGAG